MAEDSRKPSITQEYFAAKPADQCASILMKKIHNWVDDLVTNGYLDKVRRSWIAYHGAYYNSTGNSHSISFSGSQGELAQFPVNHYHNFGKHLLNMTTSVRPSMSARSINTDYKSLTQTVLANGLLDYYMREKKLERYLKLATEYAIVLGEGYVKVEWDSAMGKEYDINPYTQSPIYEGDIIYRVLSPFDVVRDSTKETSEHDWIITRRFASRYDLMARYPELSEEIKAIPSKNRALEMNFGGLSEDQTDDIPVYEFYHRRSESMRDGRYMMFVSASAVLTDGPLPYRDLPVYRIAPSNILGTPYGYTVMFDLLPIQDALNMLYSTVLTNQHMFGVQNVAIPKGADIAISQIAGGLNILEYNKNVGMPTPLNLTQTPAEVFSMISRLESTMETLSGINSVVRGNPEASLKSGAALALVQAQAIQFASGLQQAYTQILEDAGTATIKILQDFATVPRVAEIVGKTNKSYMEEFTGADLTSISRVVVQLDNPLSKSTAGRLEIANNLMQMNLIKSLDQYFMVLNTGNLDVMIEGDQAALLNIKSENEALMNSEQVIALITDSHQTHILEHKALLDDPSLRRNPQLVQLVLAHMEEHKNLLKNGDKDWLQITGQQPLPPEEMQPGQPIVDEQGKVGPIAQDNPSGIPAQLAQPVGIEDQLPQLPNMPRPAGNPDQPMTPEENLAAIAGAPITKI